MTAQVLFYSQPLHVSFEDVASRFKNYLIVFDSLFLFDIEEAEQTACKHAIEYIFCDFDFVLTFKN